ncbi:hypothetical protein V6V47_16085 [Micromonospora sp. CPCC 205539]|uniref:hypothetical protein n=1 Tax=Micromonospora sp. CPCC 205539 TaxID=3122408 RepID=UPI002FF42471
MDGFELGPPIDLTAMLSEDPDNLSCVDIHRGAYAAFLAHPRIRLEHRLNPTDHALSDHRVVLARTIEEFRDRHLRAPALPHRGDGRWAPRQRSV